MQDWIDAALSAELPFLRDRGEGQSVEFKESFPSNGFDLSREIAAFASTNAGMILVGISDSGEPVGIQNGEDPKVRDELMRRLEGICQGNIRPAITPSVRFAKEGSAIVLIIEVPRGKQPIYYSKNTPYVRHLSSSRPAEPNEVIERIEEWLPTNSPSKGNEVADRFYTDLAQILVDVLILTSEANERNVNPWLGLLTSQLKNDGRQLRALAAENFAIKDGLVASLKLLADELDRIGGYQFYLGGDSWRGFKRHVDAARELAANLKVSKIDVRKIIEDKVSQIKELVKKSSRQLNDLDARARTVANDGQVKPFLEDVSRIGEALLKLSYYDNGQPKNSFEKIRKIGRDLHLVETTRLRLDGGISLKRVLDEVHNCATELDAVSSEL
jgi:ATP-dependent DNA helicase RecG